MARIVSVLKFVLCPSLLLAADKSRLYGAMGVSCRIASRDFRNWPVYGTRKR
jgi:hypothetical protein